jgi:Protein of unknown function (DUF2568)
MGLFLKNDPLKKKEIREGKKMNLSLLKNANLGLAFLLELAMLAALGYSGFVIGPNLLVKIVLGIGVPVIAIVVWSRYGAPMSSRRLKGIGYVLLRVICYGLALVALLFAGQPVWSVVFALVVILNFALVIAWGQQ